MLSKNKIKSIQRLKLKKYRYQFRTYLLEGEKMAEEILRHSPEKVREVLATQDWLEANQAFLSHTSMEIQEITEAELKKISLLKTPNKVLILAEMMPTLPEDEKIAISNAAFFLDGIQDPGNLGTILRIADWFGFYDLFCSPGTVDLYNPKVVQASMGAFFRVNVQQLSLGELLERSGPLTVYGADLKGESVFSTEWEWPSLVVMGNESQGIKKETASLIREFVHIPSYKGSEMESLNAGIATGIIAAVLRQAIP
jgi:TrmH family RNA methyltransferase